ncbi:WXG100 family type VII secretion target [Nocardia transvalensis]|uniref:WXG100 family type VII secretion target n=1 Tax=Nocardia transvalensis TaxID=37333 RepID=UPI001895DB49|nr:WXG100 family type VII secretion target [Nocardia transvalensis]MBF6327548.1 WXG100 family type VII secretion target [Nocardia transvalensis]
MAATRVEVTPAQLRRAAGDMGELRDRVRGILDTLEKSLATKGAAWGDDSYGSTFADGEQGYVAAHRSLRDGMGKTAETIGSYSTGQYHAADVLELQDIASAGHLHSR